MKNHRFLITTMLTAVFALGGCWVDPDPAPRTSPTNTTEPTVDPSELLSENPARVTIASNESIVSEPGQGAGVFVEYHGEGNWLVWATCDTALSGTPCDYTLRFRTSSSASLGVVAIDSNNTTYRTLPDAQTIETSFTTTNGINSISLNTTPAGAQLELEVWLDDVPDPRVVYWVGPEVLHTGAPTNPIIFEPQTP
jgi:hypothetical protein